MGFNPDELLKRKAEKDKANGVIEKASVFTDTPEDTEGENETSGLEGTQAQTLAETVATTEFNETAPTTDTNETESITEDDNEGTDPEPTEETIEQPVKQVVAVGNSTDGITETTLPTEVPESVLDKEPQKADLTTQVSLADTKAFRQLAEDPGLSVKSETYAEVIESMISQQCQLSGVKNLDLNTFGMRAQDLTFPNLTVLTYGMHKFLGVPFSEEEEELILHRLGVYVALSDKKELVISAVQEVKDERGMSYYSLLFDDKIAQKFANVSKHIVKANINQVDVSKLVIVIQK